MIADLAIKNGYTDICFIDDCATGACMGFPIIGTSAAIKALDDGNTDFIVGVGNNAIRKRIAEQYAVNWVSLIHPSAQIGTNVTIGRGTVVMAGAVINVAATIGVHCIINSGSIVEHDNVIEDYVHLSPRCVLGGTVRVGKGTHVGIGTAVINNVDICENCVIGAGAAVVKSITQSGTYVGVPAQRVKGSPMPL